MIEQRADPEERDLYHRDGDPMPVDRDGWWHTFAGAALFVIGFGLMVALGVLLMAGR